MAKKYTNAQRDRILAAARSFLENQGIDVDQLEQEATQQRAARRLFSTPLGEGVNSRFQTIPEGFEEFRAVGRHGAGRAPRCMARSRRSGRKQCNAIAKAGFRVCIRHGAKAHGTKTPGGIARSAAHLLDHGKEKRETRRRRSEASRERRELEREMIGKGLAVPAIRGPRPGKNGRIDIDCYLKRRKQTERGARSRAKRVLDKS